MEKSLSHDTVENCISAMSAFTDLLVCHGPRFFRDGYTPCPKWPSWNDMISTRLLAACPNLRSVSSWDSAVVFIIRDRPSRAYTHVGRRATAQGFLWRYQEFDVNAWISGEELFEVKPDSSKPIHMKSPHVMGAVLRRGVKIGTFVLTH